MELGNIAQALTAFFGMITALGGVIVTLKVMIPNYRVNRETHTIVNQQKTDMERFQVALINELVKHGIEVPIDQSKPVAETEK